MKKEKISTGLVEFVLPFDRGTEKIYFNPNDVDFFTRITEMIENIGSIYEAKMTEIEAAKDGIDKIKIMESLNQEIKDRFDYAFGNKVSDGIFKYVSPHGIIADKKQHYVFYILEWILPRIAEETGKASQETVAALEKAVKKHGVKYADKLS